MSYIKAFTFSHPILAERYPAIIEKSNFGLAVGFYADDGTLTDISDQVTINILNSPADNSYTITPATYLTYSYNSIFVMEIGSYVFEIVYTNSGETWSYLLGVEAAQFNRFPDSNEIYSLLARKEPPEVYTTSVSKDSPSYVDRISMAKLFLVLYEDIQLAYDQIYPRGGNIYWEFLLNGTNGVLSGNSNYNKLMEFTYKLQVQNSCQKYDIEFFTGRYIYYFTGIKTWCFLQEVLPPGSTEPTGNPYLTILYVVGVSGTFTPTSDQENQIFYFVRKMIPFWFDLEINYSSTLAALGLTEDIGLTYKADPRLFLVDYAVQFDTLAVEQAYGFKNPHSVGDLVSIAITPPTGTALTQGVDVPYTVIGTYSDSSTVDLTAVAVKVSSDTSVLNFTNTSTDHRLLPLEVVASVNFSAFYGILSDTVTYSIVPPPYWIIGTSRIGISTIIGP